MNVPFSRPDLSRFIQEGTDAAVSKVTFPDGTSQATAATTAPTSYFGIDFFPRTYNGDLDGLQYLTQVGPDPNVGPNPTMFINLPFSYKVIGLSASFDTDNGSFDYDFQIFTRDAGTGGDGAAVGDVIQFSTVTGDNGTRTHSALFTTPQDITSSKDVALNLDSTATGASPEYIVKLWCQTV